MYPVFLMLAKESAIPLAKEKESSTANPQKVEKNQEKVRQMDPKHVSNSAKLRN
jgi:hypothetical protein